MSITNLPGDMWERGQFFALASIIGQPAAMADSIANGMRGCQPPSANPAEIEAVMRAAEKLEGAACTLRRIVAGVTAKPVLLIAAE